MAIADDPSQWLTQDGEPYKPALKPTSEVLVAALSAVEGLKTALEGKRSLPDHTHPLSFLGAGGGGSFVSVPQDAVLVWDATAGKLRARFSPAQQTHSIFSGGGVGGVGSTPLQQTMASKRNRLRREVLALGLQAEFDKRVDGLLDAIEARFADGAPECPVVADGKRLGVVKRDGG